MSEGPPTHLHPTWGSRGFLFLPEIPSTYGGHVAVSESSNASDAHIWLRTTAPVSLDNPDGEMVKAPIHLLLDDAVKLAEQILLLRDWHYQRADPHERNHMKLTVWVKDEPVD